MRKPVLWALDFGEESVVAVAAEEKNPGMWVLLGGGEARARGVKNGEIEKLTDAVESVVEAVQRAEKSSRRRCRQLYYNFRDVGMVSAHPRGVKLLIGEGQIGRSDTREAAQSALRLVGDFEKTPVYSREIRYVIDDKDPVGNPLGVFGHRLDVVLHVLLARSRHLEQWKKLMRRSEIERAIPVPSLVSAFHGALPKKSASLGNPSSDREGQVLRQIVWDLGRDLFAGGVVEKNALLEFAVFSKGSLSWADLSARITASNRLWTEQYGVPEPLVLTGTPAAHDGAFHKLSAQMGFKTVWAPPTGFFDLPEKYASVAGLLGVAAESQRSGGPRVTMNKDLVGQVREKASALMQEYF